MRVFQTVRDSSGWRRDADTFHASLYAGTAGATGLRHGSSHGLTYSAATLPYNLCRSSVDTLTAKIAKHRPLPQVLASRGNWSQNRRAKKMTQYLEGAFYQQRIFEQKAKLIVRDACIFGWGLLKVWREGARVCSERAHPWEVHVDEVDGRYGDPRNLYHERSMDKGVVLERWGDRKEVRDAIESATNRVINDNADADGYMASTVDRVDVVEAWHLCDDEAAHENDEEHECSGRHVVAVHGATLVDEEWGARFPFAILRYNEPLSGYRGQGLVEQLEGYQYQINLASERTAEMFRMSGVHIVTQAGSGVIDTDIRNGIGKIISSRGAPPQVLQLDLVNEHMRARPRELLQDGLNDSGLSQMSVQSQKPAGITAAVALQTLDDIETERFIVFGRAFETWCRDVAELLIDAVRAIAEEEGEYEVRVPMRTGALDLKWSDVEVDGFTLKVFPTSALPQQPAARMQRLQDWFNTGLIDKDQFLRLSDAPDLQGELDLMLADKMNVADRVESMLDLPEDADEDERAAAYKPPTPFQSFTWAAKWTQMQLNKAETDGAPQANLDLLRRYISDCLEMEKRANPPPPPPAPPMPDAGAPPPMDPAMMPPPAPGAPPMAA